MHIKTVVYIFKEMQYLKRTLKKYSKSLAEGNYYLSRDMRSLTLNITETKHCASRYFKQTEIPGKITKLISILNEIRYFRVKKSRDSKYELLYSANNSDDIREIKLFSFKEKKILTVCVDEESRDKQIVQYNEMHKCYNMPKVEVSSEYPNAMLVSMVSISDVPSEYYALNNIVSSTVAYNSNCSTNIKQSVRELIKFDYNAEVNQMLSSLIEKIDEGVLDLQISLCLQHGDLSKSNLIYGECEGKTDFWWIDWEHAKDRVFFYDFFFYIFHSAVCLGDLKPFEAYISEGFNERLKAYFEQFELDFNSKLKIQYFLMFTIVFLKERVCDPGIFSALKTYCSVIDKLCDKVNGV